MSVGELCNRDVVCTTREASVADAAQLMRRYHIGDIVVVDRSDGRAIPVGILTDRDIVVEVVAARVDPSEITVGDLLTGRLEAIEEGDSDAEALHRMSAAGVRRLPVVDRNGVLVGIVTIDDLLPPLCLQLSAVAELSSRSRTVEASLRK
jgi:CBS domain-containing protein